MCKLQEVINKRLIIVLEELEFEQAFALAFTCPNLQVKSKIKIGELLARASELTNLLANK